MGTLPFTGLRILDFTHTWAAPIAGRILGDFGAEVIKVEYIPRLDFVRGARKKDQLYNHHPRWHQVNRNKRSITLDLHREEDLAAFKDLVKLSDVVLNNARPSVMERFGLTYVELKHIKEDIIFVTMTAFGATGPYAGYGGYGATIEALSGMQELTAYERDGKRYRIREMDVTNGLVGACAVMTALIHRQRTGEGQYVDVSQMEAGTYGLIGEHLLEYCMNGYQTLPLGNRHPVYAPQGCYRCKDDDTWITITVRTEDEWRRLCEVIEQPDWKSDARVGDAAGRKTRHDELDAGIEAWTEKRTSYDAMHIFQQAGIPAGAVLKNQDLVRDPHLEARHYFITPENGSSKRYPGMIARLSEGGGRMQRQGPDLGEGNPYVLCDLLGRPKEFIRPIREEDIGTSFDPE